MLEQPDNRNSSDDACSVHDQTILHFENCKSRDFMEFRNADQRILMLKEQWNVRSGRSAERDTADDDLERWDGTVGPTGDYLASSSDYEAGVGGYGLLHSGGPFEQLQRGRRRNCTDGRWLHLTKHFTILAQ